MTSRYYTVKGRPWEARFLRKGELFPDTETTAPRQGVWARPVPEGWDGAVFLGDSWRFVDLEPAVRYLSDRLR